MRTHFVVASLTLAAALTACGRQDTPTAAKTRTGQPSEPASDLAAAPRPYQRMRFVSELEQSRSTERAIAPTPARHASRAIPRQQDAMASTRAALASLVPSAPVATAIASGQPASPSVAVSSTQAAPPMSMPAEVAGEFAAADRGHDDGPFVGHVMIRGGVGPNGKCDPRSDAQAAGMLSGRPNSAMPMMPSTSVFGRR